MPNKFILLEFRELLLYLNFILISDLETFPSSFCDGFGLTKIPLIEQKEDIKETTMAYQCTAALLEHSKGIRQL